MIQLEIYKQLGALFEKHDVQDLRHLADVVDTKYGSGKYESLTITPVGRPIVDSNSIELWQLARETAYIQQVRDSWNTHLKLNPIENEYERIKARSKWLNERLVVLNFEWTVRVWDGEANVLDETVEGYLEAEATFLHIRKLFKTTKCYYKDERFLRETFGRMRIDAITAHEFDRSNVDEAECIDGVCWKLDRLEHSLWRRQTNLASSWGIMGITKKKDTPGGYYHRDEIRTNSTRVGYEPFLDNEMGDQWSECCVTNRIHWISELVWLEYNQEYVHEDQETVYCEVNQCDILEEDSRHGYTGTGGRSGYWHRDYDDYIYCEDNDEYYFDSDVASDCGVQWCDDREMYTTRPTNMYFKFPYSYSHLKGRPKLKYVYGAQSRSFKQTNGMKYTFGVEMETCNSASTPINAKDHDLFVESKYDGSTSGPEYATGPLTGDDGLLNLNKLCKRLQICNHKVDKSCGVHVHIGGATHSRKFQALMVMLGLQIQDEVFTIVAPSRQSNTYCKPIHKKYFKQMDASIFDRSREKWAKTLKALYNYTTGSSRTFSKDANKKTHHPNGHYCSSRYKWLNLNNCSFVGGPETVEFRCHGASLDENKIINWVKLCMAIVYFAETKGRRILIGFTNLKKFESGQEPTPGSHVTLREIIFNAFGQDQAQELYNYVLTRAEKFRKYEPVS